MVNREDRFQEVEAVEEAYDQLEELDEKYDADFSEPLNLLEDVLSEEPEQSATMTYRQAYIALENIRSETDLDSSDAYTLTKIQQTLEEETDSFPATGTDRHYDLDERRKNL